MNGICQHRILEKDFINSLNLKTAKYKRVSSLPELSLALEEIGTPCILKTVGGGYDGKGQFKIQNPQESVVAFETLQKFRKGDCILESFVTFSKEVSVIVCRDKQGHIHTFPVAENTHSNHVLHQSIIPALIPDSTAKEAREAAVKIATAIDLVGVLAVEMFIVEQNQTTQVYINELAPRPHNSGHWTIEGAETSQFAQLVRAITGIPLGTTNVSANKIVMQNLLGDEILQWKDLIQQPRTYVHIYGKNDIKPGRKMGHFTKLFDNQ